MATYKVLQDIEAEDKLLGPLTLRQFIYASIFVVLGFIVFKMGTSGAWWVALIFAPFMAFFGVLAAPFGHDQSSEVWMLAKIRFAIKPRLHIWDQSGRSDMVTITAPKAVNKFLSDGLSQTEVRSRLQALATTIDSRGWAVKELGYDPYDQTKASDRLAGQSNVAQDEPVIDLNTVVDVMDENTNQTAKNFDQLVAASEESHRRQIAEAMRNATQVTTTKTPTKQTEKNTPKPQKDKEKPDLWFLHEQKPPTESGISIFDNPPVIVPGSKQTNPAPAPTVEELAIVERAHEAEIKPLPTMYHLNRLEPLDDSREGKGYDSSTVKISPIKMPVIPKKPVTTSIPLKPATVAISPKPQAASPESPPPDTINIARLAGNNDLNLETISREANRETVKVDTSDDEVTISLHFHEGA